MKERAEYHEALVKAIREDDTFAVNELLSEHYVSFLHGDYGLLTTRIEIAVEKEYVELCTLHNAKDVEKLLTEWNENVEKGADTADILLKAVVGFAFAVAACAGAGILVGLVYYLIKG